MVCIADVEDRCADLDNGLQLHGPQMVAGSVLVATGYTAVRQARDQTDNMPEISLAEIKQVDAVGVFVADWSECLEIPDSLLRQRDAYRRQQIHLVDDRASINGIGITGSNAILDTLATIG